jgi:hypothetical protein
MEKIFLNFRTGDQDMAASFLHRALAGWFGADEVFFSSHSIPAGADFPAELVRHAQQCQVLLALIGPHWLTMAGPDGQPLLAHPGDWVRREIATALGAGRQVLPVLLANAPRLSEPGLPAEIAPLAGIEYRHLRRRDLAADLRTLQGDLMKLIPGIRRQPRPEPAGHINVDVGHNRGRVAGVVVHELDASDGTLSGMLGDVSTRVERNEGVSAGAMVGKWNRSRPPRPSPARDRSQHDVSPDQDDSEEWGNTEELHASPPEVTT